MSGSADNGDAAVAVLAATRESQKETSKEDEFGRDYSKGTKKVKFENHLSESLTESQVRHTSLESLTFTPPKWMPDAASPCCADCGARFSFFHRRHHCRACGGVFCDRCSRFRATLMKIGYIDPQRVCEACAHAVIEEAKRITDYEFCAEIGEGAFSTVYEARRIADGKRFAIKVVNASSLSGSFHGGNKSFTANSMIDTALNEIKALVRLRNHKHIVQIEDVIFSTEAMQIRKMRRRKRKGKRTEQEEQLEKEEEEREQQVAEARRREAESLGEPGKERKTPLVFKHIHIVMELITGGELFDRIVLNGTFSEKDAARLARELLASVAFAHAQGVVHRDLKPENILLSSEEPDADLKISDFGLSGVSEHFTEVDLEEEEDAVEKAGSDVKLGKGQRGREREIFGQRRKSIATGQKEKEVVRVYSHRLAGTMGTPGYIAPEMASFRAYNEKVDLWSVGMILYVMLAGGFPFTDEAIESLSYTEDIEENEVSFDYSEWRDISDAAKDLIRKLLERDPSRRLSARAALKHEWLSGRSANPKPRPRSVSRRLGETLEKQRGKKRFRRMVMATMAIQRLKLSAAEHAMNPAASSSVEDAPPSGSPAVATAERPEANGETTA